MDDYEFDYVFVDFGQKIWFWLILIEKTWGLTKKKRVWVDFGRKNWFRSILTAKLVFDRKKNGFWWILDEKTVA